MKSRWKKTLSLLLCMCVLLPSGGTMAFATEDGVNTMPSANVMEEQEQTVEEQKQEESEKTTTEEQQKEEKQEAKNTKEKAAKKDSKKKAVNTDDSFEIVFSVDGEGILTVN